MSQKSSMLPVGVEKVQFSFRNHILPPLFGILVSLAVFGALNFPMLQAKIQYYINQFDPPKLMATTSAPNIDKNLSQIIIPAISVKAPINYVPSIDNNTIAYSLRSGVVHYGTTALPGQNGNVVIFGHSSGVAWAPGDYKFVFTLLEKLNKGQQIVIDYNGSRYTYQVTDSKIVNPSDMSVLKSNGTAQLTLITCTPVGTSKNRLIVIAEQVTPSSVKNTAFVPSHNAELKQIPAGD